MKKVVAFIALVAMISSCSQYSCPTYAKKDVKEVKQASKKI